MRLPVISTSKPITNLSLRGAVVSLGQVPFMAYVVVWQPVQLFFPPFRADRHAPWEILGTQNVMTPLLLFPAPRGSQRPQHQRDGKEPWQPHHTYLPRPSRCCTAATSLPLFSAPLTPDVCIYREATQTHFFLHQRRSYRAKKGNRRQAPCSLLP